MTDEKAKQSEDQGQDASNSRRDFTRKALLGGAALATLANRPAWGQDSIPVNCVSMSTWDSYTTPGNIMSSSPAMMRAERGETQSIMRGNTLESNGDLMCAVDVDAADD